MSQSEVSVCDCHVWSSIQEMHDYVVALEKKVKILEEKEQGVSQHPGDPAGFVPVWEEKTEQRALTNERLTEIKQELAHDLWPPVADIMAMVVEIQQRRRR